MLKNNLGKLRKEKGISRNLIADKITTSSSNIRYLEDHKLTGKIWEYIEYMIKEQGIPIEQIIVYGNKGKK